MTAGAAPGVARASRARLRDVVQRRFALSTELPLRLAEQDATRIATACRAMARRFEAGGRLIVFGMTTEASDVAHVVVEFVHPVLVGKRALPAFAVGVTGAGSTDGVQAGFVPSLTALGHPSDIALALGHDGWTAPVREGLAMAREIGMLTVGLTSGADGTPDGSDPADFIFTVPTGDRMATQEVHETLYHVIWELTHLFFEPGRPL